MGRYRHDIVVWLCDDGDVMLFRNYAGIISHYGWGSGFYSWLSRNGHPDEFDYNGVHIKRYSI